MNKILKIVVLVCSYSRR